VAAARADEAGPPGSTAILALCVLLFALLASGGWHILTHLKPPWEWTPSRWPARQRNGPPAPSDHVRRRRRVAPMPIGGRDWERPRSSPMSEGDAVSDLDRLEAAAGECREMIREAHAATKDLRAAVREAKTELHALTRDEVAAHIQLEVSRQLEELDERTREAISAATQKVIAEFDRFGESLLGKETYWQKASGRRAVPRPDTDVVTLDAEPDQDKG
jgi:hypothetical protein